MLTIDFVGHFQFCKILKISPAIKGRGSSGSPPTNYKTLAYGLFEK